MGKTYEEVHTQVKAKPERWVRDPIIITFIYEKLLLISLSLLFNLDSHHMIINHLNLKYQRLDQHVHQIIKLG
jgi:hypothetical protein